MSKIIAKVENNELIITKQRARMKEKDCEIIPLDTIKRGAVCESTVKFLNKKLNNKVILMVDNIECEYEDTSLVVYTEDSHIYYTLGSKQKIYQSLINVKTKVLAAKLNKRVIKLFGIGYIVNKCDLKIDKIELKYTDNVRKDVKIKIFDKVISRKAMIKNRCFFASKVSLKEIENDETQVNNKFEIILTVNNMEVPFNVVMRSKRVKRTREYYAPIQSAFKGDMAYNMRRTLRGNIMFIKRQKDDYEKTLRYKLLENRVVSFLFYHFGNIYKKFSRKPINLFYEKFASKAEEGAYDLFVKAKESKTSKNYFIITKESDDYKRIAHEKNVVAKYSLKYYFLIYTAKQCIATEAPVHLYILRGNNKYIRRILGRITFIFLQHGIIYMKSLTKNCTYTRGKEAEPDYIIVSSEKEKDITSDMLKLDENRIIKTGLGALGKVKYKHITEESDDKFVIMLTWKPYEEHLYEFEQSTYYKYTVEIYNLLKKYMDEKNIIIVPHPKVKELLLSTDMKDSIWHGPVSEVLAIGKALITDYSSVCYNSFYQGAGVIFYQPDIDVYESENGKLIPEDEEYIGKRVFNIEELEEVLKTAIVDKKIKLAELRTKKHEENYKTINEFNDGKNIERIFAELQKRKMV